MSEPDINDSEIQKLLQRIRKQSSQGEYIYRGESQHYEKISSTLYRRYAEKIDAEYFDIQTAQKEMLEQVKAYTDFTDETDMLTELQHYGGKTNLIDFTTDYLTALFFACDSSPEQAGRIILLNKKSNQETISSPKKNQNNRVISQKSVFFQSPKGYLDENDSAVEIISIPKEMKQPVLDYLRKYHGITMHTIYSDIFGYIQNQEKHQIAYAEFYIGLTSQEKGEYEEAIKHYDQTIRINPQLAAAYGNRGNAKLALGRHDEAIADYAEVTRINPQDARAYFNLGWAKRALGRHDDALADYDEALRINPQYAEGYINRGNAKFDLKLYEDALTDYNEAIRLQPHDSGAYYNRGNTKAALGKRDEAIADFDEALRLNPHYAQAYNSRGVAKGILGRYEDAILDFNLAIRASPQHAAAYVNRGNAKRVLGRDDEAIDDYAEIIRINPGDAYAYYNRGNAYKEMGKNEEARGDLKRVIQLATEQGNQELAQDARRLLGELPLAGSEN